MKPEASIQGQDGGSGGPDYARGACESCGARTALEAETACQPYVTQDGEHYCCVGDDEIDEEGFVLRLTDAGIARRDRWVDEQVSGGRGS